MKKKVIFLLCIFIVFSISATALPNYVEKEPQPTLMPTTYSHTVLGESGTATWCYFCKFGHGALKNIYAGTWHPFYYVSLVDDECIHAENRLDELGLAAFPTVFFDGGFTSVVGAGSVPGAQAEYNTSIVSCGDRSVKDIEINLTVDWLGNAVLDVEISVDNNEATAYNGHLHVYVTEIVSTMGWIDSGGHAYTFPLLDYAFNQDISIPAGSTWSSSTNWDGHDHFDGYGNDFGDIEYGNIMVIAAVYRGSTNHVEETAGFRVGANNPPNTPSNPVPDDEATWVLLDQDLSWTGGDPENDITTYDVYFEANDPTPDELVSDDQYGTSYALGTLILNTTYYWQIIATDIYGETTTGPIWEFTTRTNDPPNDPGNPSPEDGATDVYINTDLSWTGGDPDPGDTVTYDVYFSTSSPPSIMSRNQSETFYDLDLLDFDTTYYWQIVAWDPFDEVTIGTEWSFTTEANQPPHTPHSPTPGDGATDVNTEQDLEWEGGDPNPGDTVKYDVYFGTNSPPPLVSQNKTFTIYNPGSLDLETAYYWKIIAWDSQHQRSPGPEWTFTTSEYPNIAPTDPDIDGKINLPVDVMFEFTFVSTDDNGDQVFYFVDWGDGTDSGWKGPYNSGAPIILEHSWTEKESYTIRAKAKDTVDAESDWAYLDIEVPLANDHSTTTKIIFGFFPQIEQEMIHFWNQGWNHITEHQFKGYVGKFFLFGRIIQ